VVGVTYLKFIKAVDTISAEIPVSKIGDGTLDKTKVRKVQNCFGNKVFSERLDNTCLLGR